MASTVALLKKRCVPAQQILSICERLLKMLESISTILSDPTSCLLPRNKGALGKDQARCLTVSSPFSLRHKTQ